MHYGSAEIGRVFHGSTEIGEGWVWDAGAWKRVFSAVGPIINSRADKNAPQDLVNGSWVPVTWTSGTGDPVVADAIVISGEGAGLVGGEVRHSTPGAGLIPHFRITVNGLVIAEVTPAPGSGTTTIPFTPAPLAPGDWVQLEGLGRASSSTNRRVGAGTLLTVAPIPQGAAMAVVPASFDHNSSTWTRVTLAAEQVYRDTVIQGGAILVKKTGLHGVRSSLLNSALGAYLTRVTVNGVEALLGNSIGGAIGASRAAGDLNLVAGDIVALEVSGAARFGPPEGFLVITPS